MWKLERTNDVSLKNFFCGCWSCKSQRLGEFQFVKVTYWILKNILIEKVVELRSFLETFSTEW